MKPGRVIPLLVAACSTVLAAWLVLDGERQHGHVSGVFADIESSAVVVPADAAKPLADGTIVLLSGEPKVGGPARGVNWPIVAERALRLDREVQMFQWKEQVEGSGDNKNVNYTGVWSSTPIDSRYFQRQMGNRNPTEWPFVSLQSLAPDSALGRHRLTRRAIEPIHSTVQVHPPDTIAIASGDLEFRRAGDWYYHGSPDRPLIGDVRIRWRALPLQPISVIGIVDNGSVVPVKDAHGKPVALAEIGKVTLDDLLAHARGRGVSELWTGRALGSFILLIAGLGLAVGLAPDREMRDGSSRKLTIRHFALAGLSMALVGTTVLMMAGWLLFRI